MDAHILEVGHGVIDIIFDDVNDHVADSSVRILNDTVEVYFGVKQSNL